MLDEAPLTGAIGAEIRGVDLGAPIGEDLAGALRRALARCGVLVFHDQRLDLDAQLRLTAAFGAPMRLPYIRAMEGRPEVIRVHKPADDRGGVFGGDWHADLSFLERPPAGSVLAASVVPPWGGDTLWASGAAAWEALPEPLQDLLLGRDAIHVGKPYGVRWAPPEGSRASVPMTRGDPAADADRRHPAVIENPLTGRRSLFLNPLYVTRIGGLTEAESAPILDAVQRHVLRPEFGLRLRWQAGTVAVWDNFATQHYAVNDYAGHERMMHRTAFAGPSPRELAAA